MEITQSELIIFEKSGKVKTVTRPQFGEVIIKFKDGQPYDVEVKTKIKL
ncbi:hypothetical protein PFZ59_02855 [Streptococcus suis]|nr:hypothetical protein [Streptococcus suis]WFA76416.1 hypothetical protein PFZ59_02855 [Streptococcus suis]